MEEEISQPIGSEKAEINLSERQKRLTDIYLGGKVGKPLDTGKMTAFVNKH